MKNISLDLSGKIDSQIAALLKEIKSITDSLRIRFLVIGATARDIILEAGYGISTGRKTKDVDFAVMVEDWTAYDRLKMELLSTSHIIENKKILHRFRFKDILDVDILPFGEIENPKGTIKWPEDRSVMKVLGFREALESGILVKINPILQVPFVSPAGMAALKLIAWSDRRHEFPEKDISDFALVLTKYSQLGNEDRIYEEDPELMKEEGSDLDYAGARLLGRDIGRMMNPEARAEIERILNVYADPEKNDDLITGLAKQLPGKDYNRARKLLDRLKTGLQETGRIR